MQTTATSSCRNCGCTCSRTTALSSRVFAVKAPSAPTSPRSWCISCTTFASGSGATGVIRQPQEARADSEAHRPILTVRDGLTFDEACEVVWSRGVTVSRRELELIVSQLPARIGTRRAVPIDSLPEPEGKDRSDTGLELDEALRRAHEIQRALRSALDQLPHRERLAVQLRFYDGEALAWIVRSPGDGPEAVLPVV